MSRGTQYNTTYFPYFLSSHFHFSWIYSLGKLSEIVNNVNYCFINVFLYYFCIGIIYFVIIFLSGVLYFASGECILSGEWRVCFFPSLSLSFYPYPYPYIPILISPSPSTSLSLSLSLMFIVYIIMNCITATNAIQFAWCKSARLVS